VSQVTGTVVGVPDDELRRVTPSLLKSADRMCPRRLKHEFESGKDLAGRSDARFELSNRLAEDARLAHAELGPPTTDAFVEPSELEPEQRAVYRAAVAGYLRAFGDQVVVADDIGRVTELTDLGVRLSGTPGLAVTDEQGHHELRVLGIGRVAAANPADRAFTVLRAVAWAADSFTLTTVDLLDPKPVREEIDVATERGAALDWITARVRLVESRADRARTRVGADCRTCSCIPGCPALTGS